MKPCDGRPLGEPSTPEELAQLIHLQAPVLEVELEVAVEPEVGRNRQGAGGQLRLVQRERRDLAQPLHLPEQEDEKRRDGSRPTGERLAPPPCHDIGERDADRDQEVRRLERCCGAQEEAREHGIRHSSRRKRAHDEENRHEDEHHGREVRQRRQPERLREEVLGPAFLVAIDEERDGRKWSDHPEERGPVAEQTPADPGCDPVQTEQRRRAQHEDLREDQRRQRLHVRRSCRPRDGCLGRGPQVRDFGGWKLGLAEHPAGRRQHDLVATLVPDPAVVVDGKREHKGRRDLEADERP